MSQEFDIIVFGASGFTGRLVAEYLAATYPTGVRWAMGGRSLEKLAQVRDEIGAPGDTPLVVCDSDDAASLKAMVTATKVVLTTVGPYQLYGNGLVAACAEHGTVVDLCGRPSWHAKNDRRRQLNRAPNLLSGRSSFSLPALTHPVRSWRAKWPKRP